MNDWHLPTKDVLNAMYENMDGFANGAYWSSTEYNSRCVWTQYFDNGSQYFLNEKNYLKRVRAVRVLPKDHIETDNVFKLNEVDYQMYKEDSPKQLNWEEAIEYCEGLNTVNHSLKELIYDADKLREQNEEMFAMLVDIVDLYQNVIPGKHEKEIRELIQKVEGNNK